MVVTNPVDILTHVTRKLSGFKPGRVIGSGTVLDTARLRFLIGEHFNVDPRDTDAVIIGEHGIPELAVWSRASVSGIPAQEFCSRCGKCLNMDKMHALFEDAKNSAYRIIESKGATYYAVSLAVSRIVESIIREENSVLTVSVDPGGLYGLRDVSIASRPLLAATGLSRCSSFRSTSRK